MINWSRHNWLFLALGTYGLTVGYGVVIRGFGLWDAMFTAPVAVVLVGAVLFLLIYEALAIALPFLMNTALFLAKSVLPKETFAGVVASANKRWERMPEFIKKSPWMPFRE